MDRETCDRQENQRKDGRHQQRTERKAIIATVGQDERYYERAKESTELVERGLSRTTCCRIGNVIRFATILLLQ